MGSERTQAQQMHARYYWGKYRKSDLITAFFFLLPAFAVFFVFKYYPLLDTLRISFTSWNFYAAPKAVGFSNYTKILASRTFRKILGNTLYYTFWSTGLSLLLGLLLALCLFKRNSYLGRSLKTMFFIPNITTASAVAILWIWIFNSSNGLMEIIYSLFGAKSPAWLLDKNLAIWTVITLGVWRSMGYVMTIYMSGLSQIDGAVYEAARIDGASDFQQAWYITLPLLTPTTLFLLTTNLISAMQVFDVVQVMTEGGPSNATNVMNLYIYQEAFVRGKAGSAAALSIILFVLLLVLTVVQRALTREGAVNHD